MSQTGFWVDRESPGVSDMIRQIRMPNATLFSEGDACFVSTTDGSAGLILQASAQTSPVQYVFLAMVSDKSYLRPATFDEATVNEYAELIEVSDGFASFPIVLNTLIPAGSLLYSGIAFDSLACGSNSSTTTVIVGDGAAGATDDFTGGQVYINELGQQATVIDDDYSSPNHTLTVAPAFSQAPTTGMTARLVPWGPGYVGGVKLGNSITSPYAGNQQGISTAVADKTGGPIFIYGVDLALRTVYVRFQPFLIAK